MSVPNFKLDLKPKPALYDRTAKEIAQKLVKIDQKKPIGVSRHQLRRIFDEVKSINRKYSSLNNENWVEEALPLVKMIKAKTAYQVARIKKNKKNLEEFYDNLNDFIKKSIDQISEKKVFEIFTSFFEAIYCYYYESGGAETD